MASMSSKMNGPRRLLLYAANPQSSANTSGVPRQIGGFAVLVNSAIAFISSARDAAVKRFQFPFRLGAS